MMETPNGSKAFKTIITFKQKCMIIVRGKVTKKNVTS